VIENLNGRGYSIAPNVDAWKDNIKMNLKGTESTDTDQIYLDLKGAEATRW
jgi:hypothetical protein